METSNFETAQGHWILARMGKRVLRPGGKELTQKLIKNLNISSADEIVEFAPGLGFTASLALKNHPKAYIGVDADEEAVELLKRKITGANTRIILGTAAKTGLPDSSQDKVMGEAILTMQADHRKLEIIKEAHRILKPGGLYAIHELGLTPGTLSKDEKALIQRELALNIKVNARPLTSPEWQALLKEAGFRIKKVETNEMHLLEPKRLLDDEGFFRSLKIGYNVLTHPQARKRILQMRRTFQKHQKNMNAIMIVAEKL